MLKMITSHSYWAFFKNKRPFFLMVIPFLMGAFFLANYTNAAQVVTDATDVTDFI